MTQTESEGASKSLGCPYCLEGSVTDEVCDTCDRAVPVSRGVVSLIDMDEPDNHGTNLRTLEAVREEPLDDVLNQVRDHYMDGSIVDRFFKTRTVCWRFLVAEHLTGRALVVGSHEEKVGLLLAEVLEEVHVVDQSLDRLAATAALADSRDLPIEPLHSDPTRLPYPSETFDVLILQCSSARLSDYLAELGPLLTSDGSLLVLVNGWPRELGVTELLGLGAADSNGNKRALSTISGSAWQLERTISQNGLQTAEQYALLSTNRHENERVFEISSHEPIKWLLEGSGKAATTSAFTPVRLLAQVGRKSGLLKQAYPRYLFVCKDIDEETKGEPSDAILIAGKNRSTLLAFQNGKINHISKIPNSRDQAILNSNSHKVTEKVTGNTSKTIPDSELVQTAFGHERHEEPVEGTPLDQSLEKSPESVGRHSLWIRDWISGLQLTHTSAQLQLGEEEVLNSLTIEGVGLSDPPEVKSVKVPQVISHGDLFGSNIYVKNGNVHSVIDWEWAQIEANAIIDPGFYLLQLAEFVGDNFKEGFDKLFLKQERYMDQTYKFIKKYCEETGIDPIAFLIYLPIGYITRIRADLTMNKRLDLDWPKRVKHVWNRYDQVKRHVSERT